MLLFCLFRKRKRERRTEEKKGGGPDSQIVRSRSRQRKKEREENQRKKGRKGSVAIANQVLTGPFLLQKEGEKRRRFYERKKEKRNQRGSLRQPQPQRTYKGEEEEGAGNKKEKGTACASQHAATIRDGIPAAPQGEGRKKEGEGGTTKEKREGGCSVSTSA